MLQHLLEERFQVKLHREKKEFPVYTLEVAKGGLKMRENAPDPEAAKADNAPVNISGSGSAQGISVDLGRGSSYSFADNRFEAKKLNVDMLARSLQNYVGRPILDMTKDDGFYDFTLTFTPEDFLAMRIRAAQSAGISLPAEATRLLDTATIDSLIESLRKFGLTLESRRAPIDMLVVDHIERMPTEN